MAAKRHNSKTAIINANDELLLVKRSMEEARRPGGWDWPGGRQKPGESHEDTARREGLEESGIVLGTLWELGIHRRARGSGMIVVSHLFAVITEAGPEDVVLSPEHTEKLWIPRLEIGRVGMPSKYTDAVLRNPHIFEMLLSSAGADLQTV